MSTMKRMLVTLGGGAADPSVLAAAIRLARAQSAELVAVHVHETFPVEAMMTAEAATYAIEQMRVAEEAAQARVEALLRERATEVGMEIPLRVLKGELAGEIAAVSAAFDLVITGQHDPDRSARWTLDAQERLLMSAHTPVYFVPFIARSAEIVPFVPNQPLFEQALIAWAPQRESSIAVRSALPLLRAARRVQIVSYTSEPDVASARLEKMTHYLRCHGIEAEARAIAWREPSLAARLLGADVPDAPIAESLLSLAADTGADLLVTGAYGHSRAWELALGGVTHTLIRSMTLPVIMMH